jgi:hypothetical protein
MQLSLLPSPACGRGKGEGSDAPGKRVELDLFSNFVLFVTFVVGSICPDGTITLEW